MSLMVNQLIGFGAGDDGNDAFTKALLHFDGTDASTTITDSNAGGTAKTWTAGGNAQIDTAQSKFGGASLLSDGTSDYVTGDGSSDFVFGTGDFTIDFWVRWAGVGSAYALIDFRPTSGDTAQPLIYVSGTTLYFHHTGATRITGGTVAINAWYHVAVARASGTTKMFLDGAQVGSDYADATSYTVGASRPAIAAGGDTLGANCHDGWIDELRISKGIARWTANFTPPTSPYG